MSAKPEAVVDLSESLLAYLLCADSDDFGSSVGFKGNRLEITMQDAGKKLGFAPMRPQRTFTVDQLESRQFAMTSDYLVRHAQDTLGPAREFCMFSADGQAVNWIGFRRLHKRPRGVWVAKPGCDLYELHHRKIHASGRSSYGCGVAALDKRSAPVATRIEGYTSSNLIQDSTFAVMCASVIEDAHRSDAFTCHVAAESAIIFPIKAGEHLAAFALRDGPMAASGRRKALLHWVASHIRRKPKGGETTVQSHTRGACEFTVDGLRVAITANEAPIIAAA